MNKILATKRKISHGFPAWTSAALFVVAAAGCRAQPIEQDEVFQPSDVTWGKTIRQDECARLPNTAWVEHKYGSECIRYYPSRAIDGAKEAIFFFHGDMPVGSAPSAYPNNAKGLMALAESRARTYRIPFIFVARPGTFGSSGRHAERRRPKEFYSMNAAVDSIKAKHNIDKVVLVGQSGGATTVGALLTLGRTDVSCAVGGSGGYAVFELAEVKRWKAGSRSQRGMDSTGWSDSYDVIEYVREIKPDPRRRIFIVGDPKDRNTVFDLQKKFAERVRDAGHDVHLVEVRGTGPENHNVIDPALKLSSLCSAGVPTEDLIQRIQN